MPVAEVLAGDTRCVAFVEQLLRTEILNASPSVVALSIALGVLEAAGTVKMETLQRFPDNLETTVAELDLRFEGFVAEIQRRLHAGGEAVASPRSKVKLIADSVWSKLSGGSFSKDVLHAQHLYNFTTLLAAPGGASKAGEQGRRQLDCAGVVTTCYAVCAMLAARFGHADLACIRMQVSEDHCWLQQSPPGSSLEQLRQGSIEVTTVNPAQRALAVAPAAWAGWLYTGGRAVLCTPQQALTAVVASVNPQISPGKKGRDSELLQAVQWRLLSLIEREWPAALYPAALCALADLLEVEHQDALDEALAAGDEARMDALLQRQLGDASELFERAIRMAAAGACSQPAVQQEEQGERQQQQQQPAAAEATMAVAEAAGGLDPPPTLPTNGGLAAADPQPAVPASNGSPAAAGPPPMTNGSLPPAAAQPPLLEPSQQRLPVAAGWQWYPYSYLSGLCFRRMEFLAKAAAAFPSAVAGYGAAGEVALQGGLSAAAAGGAVLGSYRYRPGIDDQLYKDVEGIMEYCCDGLKQLHLQQEVQGQPIGNASLLQQLLQFWDGICLLFSGRPKPNKWVDMLLKAAKLFSSGARAAAAEGLVPASAPMRDAARLWAALRPSALRPVFETADVGGPADGAVAAAAEERAGGGGRAAKRQRA